MKARIVIWLGYGDEGKGSWVDYLVRKHQVTQVVRFNGGAQALHHVVTLEGLTHGFAQFSSGTLVPGVKTLLSKFMLIEPESFFAEAEMLSAKGIADVVERVIISEKSPVITPFNRLLNRIMERFRGIERHGSCGFGIGLTQADVESLKDRALYVKDLSSSSTLRSKLNDLWSLKLDFADRFRNESTEDLFHALQNIDIERYVELFTRFAEAVNVVSEEEFQKLLRENESVFEGAQGVMLDQTYGTFPFCTRSNTTFENALMLLREAGWQGTIERIGLLRAYGTRHGAGPFPTEDSSLNVVPCLNQLNEWQGQFRTGWFDAVLARYALECVGDVDTLVITNFDRIVSEQTLQIAVRYGRVSDSRFFRDGQMIPFTGGLQELAERTTMLAEVEPDYLDGGVYSQNDPDSVNRYLKLLEKSIGRRINTVSSSIDCKKIEFD
jgi:adenylosuccinate synthase